MMTLDAMAGSMRNARSAIGTSVPDHRGDEHVEDERHPEDQRQHESGSSTGRR